MQRQLPTVQKMGIHQFYEMYGTNYSYQQYLEGNFDEVAYREELENGDQSGDIYEQEADRFAHELTGIQHASQSGQIPIEDLPSGFKKQLDSTIGFGEELPDGLKTELEARTGADLSNVRIHTSTLAANLAKAINAKAFTYGQNIYGSAQNLDPNNPQAKYTLTHEVMHTIQQQDTHALVVQRQTDLVYAMAMDRTNSHTLYQEYIENIPITGVTYPGTLNVEVAYWYRRGEKHPEFPWMEMELSDPTIHYFRAIKIKLNNGSLLHFAIYGRTTIEGNYLPGEITPDMIPDFINQPDNPFIIAGLDAADEHLTGLDFDLQEATDEGISLNEMIGRKFPLLGKFKVSPQENYDHVLRLFDNLPDAQGWLTQQYEVISKSHKNQEDAVQDAEKGLENTGPGFGAVVIEEDGAFKTHHFGPEGMQELGKAMRQKVYVPTNEKYFVFADKTKIRKITFDGKSYEQEQIARMFFTTREMAVESQGEGDAAYYLVYRDPYGTFGRFDLHKDQASSVWRKLDFKNSSEEIEATTLEELGFDPEGFFEELTAPGHREIHTINTDYYRGREVFQKHKNALDFNAENPEIDSNGEEIDGYYDVVNNDPEGHLFEIYIRGELDRPSKDAWEFRGELKTMGDTMLWINSFQAQLGRRIYETLKEDAKDIAYSELSSIAVFLYDLATKDLMLEQQLLAFGLLDSGAQIDLLASFGFDTAGDDSKLVTILRDDQHVMELLLGLSVDGYSLASIREKITHTGAEIGTTAEQILSGAINVLDLEGDYGDHIRKLVYEKQGWTNLVPSTYPHGDQENFDLASNQSEDGLFDYINVEQQLYIDYASYTSFWEDVAIITVFVVVGVIIALVSMGIGVYVAGAIGATGLAFTATVAVVGGISATIINEILAQALGAGTLDTSKSDWGISEFLGEMAWNIGTFYLFGRLGGIGRVGKLANFKFIRALRLTLVGTAFFGLGVYQFQNEHGRLPQSGSEWGKVIYESALGLVLMEIGAFFARPIFKKLQVSGLKQHANRALLKLNRIKLSIENSQKALAELAVAKESNSDLQLQLTKAYRNHLKKYKNFLEKYKNHENVDLSLSEQEVTAEIKTIEESLAKLDEAIMLQKIGLMQMMSTETVFTYKGDKTSVKELKKMYKGESIAGPDNKTGVITITLKAGGTLVFVPESVNLKQTGTATEIASDPTVNGRAIAKNFVAVERFLFKKLQNNRYKDGEWIKISEDVYIGIETISGTKHTTVYVAENATNITKTAIDAEARQPGMGKQILNANMRSRQALEGLNNLWENKWEGLTTEEKLNKLQALESEAKSKNQSLNRVLEAEGKSIYTEKVTNEFLLWLEEKLFFEDKIVQDDITNNRVNELHGKIGEQIGLFVMQQKLTTVTFLLERTLNYWVI